MQPGRGERRSVAGVDGTGSAPSRSPWAALHIPALVAGGGEVRVVTGATHGSEDGMLSPTLLPAVSLQKTDLLLLLLQSCQLI